MSTTEAPRGTHFSDGVRVGPILGTQYTAGANVLSPSTPVSSPTDSQPPGIYLTPVSILDITPASLNAASLFALATIAGAGYVPLISVSSEYTTWLASFANTSGPTGAGVIQLDVPRNIIYTGLVNSTAVNLAVWGWDLFEQPMYETVLTTAGANVTTLKKAFKWIQAIHVDAGTTANVSVGTGNVFGLPYFVNNANYIFTQKFNGALDAGTIVVGDPKTATGTTGDVRGTYTPAANANSVKRLTVTMYNASGDTRNYNASANGTKYLPNNSLASSNLSATVVVTANNHNFSNGENVTISGAAAFNNLAVGNINITAPVTVIDANSFSYTATAAANNTGAGGGAAIQMTPAIGSLYQFPAGRFGVTQYTTSLV